MCGRYRLTAKERWLSAHFNIDPEDVEWAAKWNVAPTQEVATVLEVRREPKRRFRKMRWGLIPYWAKDSSFGGNTINAVSETAIEKPAFREPLRRRRCLIPADGFYEWKKTGSNKQTYHIGMVDDGLFSFAGLWDTWRGRVDPDDYERWLDPGVVDPSRVVDLLRPFDARLMRVYPVGAAVNRVENDGPVMRKGIHGRIGRPGVSLFLDRRNRA